MKASTFLWQVFSNAARGKGAMFILQVPNFIEPVFFFFFFLNLLT